MSSKLFPAELEHPNEQASVNGAGATNNTRVGDLRSGDGSDGDSGNKEDAGKAARVTEMAHLDRAGELEDLLEAVKSLVVPFVRAADLEAAVKPTGRLRADTQCQRQNVLVDEKSPHEVLESMKFSLPKGYGRGREGLLETIETVLRHSVNTWDQGFMDKLTASTNPVGVISEIILGVLNTNVHVFHVSPALTVIEKVTARTLASYLGFKGPRAGGITCQGGSASNFTSLVIARNVLYPATKVSGCAGQVRQFVIFTSCHGHFSVQKAAVAAGLGTSSVIQVPVDDNGCMLPSALRRLAAEAKARHELPLYVNATAGTTVFGAFDPIGELRDICNEFGMWLHVDGSWGGSVAFSTKHRHKLEECGLADSLTINPQKMLNIPMTCSFLLTNDLKRFHDACSLRAEYLFHEAESEDDQVWDLADLTLQCGRRADSLKMALAWIYYGAAGFGEAVDHAFDMAAHLTTLVAESPHFELLSANPPPCLQVCFYYAPNGGRASEDKEENTRRTRTMVRKMVGRGFMFDFAPGPRGYFFRVVTNCQTLRGTVDGLFKALCEVGRDV
ncbi:L-aspartate decarboxylase dtxS4 [Claviceps maximensis]|nr:L-aspartate decarboxylase dtxS4 [Claviceps maximensis]